MPADPAQTAMDVRAYYEEAAWALTDHVSAARQAETWFFQTTRAGTTVMAARKRMQEAGAPVPLWFAMAPLTQPQ